MICRKSTIFFISISLIPFNLLNAEIVNPIMGGEWNIPLAYGNHDNCGIQLYQYWATGKTPEEVGLEFMNKRFPRSDCKWTYKSSKSINSGRPVDFPGSSEQWKTVINQPPYIKDVIVKAECLPDPKGHQTEIIDVSPKYICPPGSRYSTDSLTHIKGCTTLPSSLCRGDMVGRALYFMKPLGHVGITTNASPSKEGAVIQVMAGHKTLIEDITFEEFKNATTYWGDKYGVSDVPSYTWDQGLSIVSAVQAQNKGIGTYESEPIFVPLKTDKISNYNQSTQTWDQQISTSYPLFRCDTFVDWVYSVGLQKSVLPYHEIEPIEGQKAYEYDHYFDVPKDLYNKLLNTRDNGSDLASGAKLENKATEQEQVEKAKYRSIVGNSAAYLTNPDINKDAKIQKNWNEYNSSDSTTKELAFGSLMLLAPTNLIPTFIDRFNTESAYQKDYLDLIIAGMQVKPKNISAEDKNNVILGQNFLKHQIQVQNEPTLLRNVIYAYNTFTPYSNEKAELISAAINRLAVIEKIDPQSLFNEKFDLSRNDVSGNSLNLLIGDLENSKYRDKFTQSIISEIDTGLNSKMLSQPNQKEISEYLLKQMQQESASFAKTDDSYITLMTKAFFIYSIIKGYGAFTNNPDYLANAIIFSKEPKLQAALIICALHNSKVMKVIKAHKQVLLLRFKNTISVNDESLLNPTSIIMQEAITNINK